MATTGLLSGGAPLFGGAAGATGILGYTPTTPATTVARGGFNVPVEQAMFEGANQYENYVRAYPDLMQHYLQNMPTDTRSMGDWGQEHWGSLGQFEGRLGPEAFPASRFLPPMTGAYDPRVAMAGGTSMTAGLPMPDVEGYKYAYRPYEWSQDAQGYTELAYDEYDIDKYPYYPYLPTGGMAGDAERILAGVKLVPDTGQEGISTTSTSSTTTGTTTGGNNWENYVTRNQDLEAAYNNYLSIQDSNIVDDWELYGVQHGVGGMSENYPGTPMSKEQFGHAHWLQYGQYEEGRTR